MLNLSLNSSWQLLSTPRSNKCNQILETSATAAITQVRCQHIMFLLCEWPADFYNVDLKTCTKLTTDKTMMCPWFPDMFRLNRDHYFIKRHVCKWLVKRNVCFSVNLCAKSFEYWRKYSGFYGAGRKSANYFALRCRLTLWGKSLYSWRKLAALINCCKYMNSDNSCYKALVILHMLVICGFCNCDLCDIAFLSQEIQISLVMIECLVLIFTLCWISLI